MPARTYTPLVTAAARRYGVELDSLAGTGPGGRVSIKDVKAAAAANAPHLRAVPPPDAAELAPQGAAWGRNPLLDQARSKDPGRTMQAFRAAGPAPTLFPTGDLPPFTASGIDPKALLQAPWMARHPIAAEPSQAAAYRMLEQYAGEDGELASEVDFTGHPGNVAYRQRMRAWIDASMSDDEHYEAMFAADDAHRAQNTAGGYRNASRYQPQPGRAKPTR